MRRWIVAAGCSVLGMVWLSPLPRIAAESFSAHMLMHVSVVAVAAPLLAIGAAQARWDPARQIPALFAPLPASALELLVVWGWHAPALHHAARQQTAAFVAEQASFLAAGFLVWLSAFGGAPRDRDRRTAAGIVGLLLTSMHMTLLGALLALAIRPVYAHSGGGLFGLSPLEDQQLGGALMLLGGGTVYLAGGLALTAALLRSRRAAS